MKKPAERYIKRSIEIESLQVRVDSNLKRQVEMAAKKLNSSLNRFSEAALNFYLEALKKDGTL